jgi:hypothetical protein
MESEFLRSSARRVRRGHLRVLFVALALCVPCSRVRAGASKTPSDELVARGLELRTKGKASEALDLFRQAHALEPTARTAGQLGLVEASLQAWMDADAHLTDALSQSEDPWVVKNRSIMEQALTVTRSHIGEIDIIGPPGTWVHVAGTEGKWPTLPLEKPLRAPEGDARLFATAVDYRQLIQHVKVVGGARTKVTLALVPQRR